MDIQETKTLDLPSGKHSAVVKTYLMGEDKIANRRTLIKITVEGNAGKVEGLEESENAVIKLIVLSLDGSSDDLIERISKLHIDDYNYLTETVSEIAEGLNKKKEKKSEQSTTPSLEDLK